MQSPAAIVLTRTPPDSIIHSSNIAFSYLGVVLQVADAYWTASGSPGWTGNPVDATLAILKACGVNLDGAAMTHFSQHMQTLREAYARGQ